ncbi:hypothetical protein B1748_35860 [Paenibacillus sp. MY03]|jgi:putative aldouronate transport system substrate-binding protein|uniref:extracellular solute-binding protein n=1 Tax=Paenibacillus sp. MY03 TaxID=302980 RepID=UPI000B3C6057|nr:extracellular solute-binding protein [Paenibacillus sp. MY03]OUS67694.1 hypothetical protein B1748_35860 [Paenibacillus sp. MY03]
MSKSKYSPLVLMGLIVAILTVIVGCSSTNNGNGEQPPVSPNDSQTESNLNPVGTFPIVKEKVTLKVLIPQGPEVIDYSTNEFTKWLEELTNVHLDFQTYPVSQPEQLNIIFASGDFPDLFIRTGLSDVNEQKYGVEQKLILPLQNYIEEQTVHLKKLLQDTPELKGVITATDGNIYGLPSLNECYHCMYGNKLWINQSWLDKLELSTPTTTDEFLEVMRAFKEMDPNGNGKPDEIPMAGAAIGWHTAADSFLMNAFELDNSLDGLKMVVRDGKVQSNAVTDGTREGLKFLNQLFEEGLLYNASFTQSSDQLKQLANSHEEVLGAFAAGANVNVIDGTANPERYRHYTTLAPLKGPDGTQYTTYFNSFPYGGGSFVISSRTEHPEVAIRLADVFFNPERVYGEGTQWRKAEEGEVGITGLPAKIKILKPYSSEPQNETWLDIGEPLITNESLLTNATDPDIDPYSPEGLGKLLMLETENKYEPYTPTDVSLLPPLKFLSDELDQVSTLRVELDNYIRESRAKFIMGNMNLESDWDAYLAAMDRIGLPKIVELMQTAYDRQYGN